MNPVFPFSSYRLWEAINASAIAAVRCDLVMS